MLETLGAELAGRGWEARWGSEEMTWWCQGRGRVDLRVGATMIWLSIGVRSFREAGQRVGFHRRARIKAPEDVSADFLAKFRAWAEAVEDLCRRYLDLQAPGK